MTATPIWFGREDRPLHGWLHRPGSGVARGAIVICPPVGIDRSYSGINLRLLARSLEEAGFVVMRFDYDGTGQSAGDMADPDRVGSWLESVSAAVDVVREAGSTWVGAIGLRLGATLAANAASRVGGFDLLVLWDPYLSGTAFLREQSAVKLGVLPQVSERVHGLAAPGYVFPPEAVAELQGLEIPSREELRADRVLVLTDPLRRTDRRLAERLQGGGVEWQEYCEKSDLFDTGRLDYTSPRPLLDQIVSWAGEACDGHPIPLVSGQTPRTTAVVACGDDGLPVVEENVRLGSLGLFGIMCTREPDAAATDKRPSILFLTIAAESSIGPARQWVEYARRLASDGIRSVRFDFSSVGESPTRPGQEERALYSPEALNDIEDAAKAISPDDPGNVILIGVCSGAYAALSAAPHVRPRAVVAINPIMTEWGNQAAAGSLPPESENGARRGVRAHSTDRRPLGAVIRSRMRDTRLRTVVVEHLPPSLWRIVFALGLSHSPAQLLTPVQKAGVPTLLICGEEEAHAAKTRTPGALRRLAADGVSRFEELPTLNHSLLHATNRETVFDLIRTFIEKPALAVDSSRSSIGTPPHRPAPDADPEYART